MSILPIRKPAYTETSDIGCRVAVCAKEAATLTLYSNGMVRTCNQVGAELLGFSVKELAGQHITRLLPQLIGTRLIQDNRTNVYLRFLSRVGHHFEVVSKSGIRFASEIFFNDVKYLGQHYLRVIIRPVR